MAMSQQQYVRAVEKNGHVCPRCGSGSVENGDYNADGVYRYQDCYCNCGYEWTDRYRLDDYIETQAPSEDETDTPEVEPEVDTAHFIVSGRIPGDDEDTTLVLELPDESDREAVMKAFADELYAQGSANRESVTAQHGQDVYVNSVVRTESKPVEM